jgi:predicted CXXCH cytochrome family protein
MESVAGWGEWSLNRSRIVVAVVLALTALGGMLLLEHAGRAERESAPLAVNGRSAIDGERENAPALERAAPQLVGRQVCGQCHPENFQLHARSGHASTFSSVRDSAIARQFVGKTLDAGPPYGAYHYFLDQAGDLRAARLDDPDGGSLTLQYALGSGHSAVTLFSLLPDDSGGTIGLEHRVSWFASLNGFGLTPGHVGKVPHHPLEFFGDPIRDQAMNRCVDCHTTSATIADASITDLIPSVNCEKCHGAGDEHVRLARHTDKPPPFSVGRDDWNAEAELQLCGSCHRLPKDISPKDLRNYTAAMIRFQPIGMLRSECYLESEGQMRCTTCHDPHQSSFAKSKQSYIADCVACHDSQVTGQVVCPVSPSDGCVNCHMPPIEFEQGMVFHDHWIRTRSEP